MKLLKNLFVFYLMIILSSPILATKPLGSSAESDDNNSKEATTVTIKVVNSPKIERKKSDLATYLYFDSPCGGGWTNPSNANVIIRPGSPASHYACCPHCP